MDQLVNMVAQRANISPDQAQTAVQTVIGFLKDKLPGPVASQLDSVASGQTPDMGQLGQMGQQAAGGLGGMFGGGSQGGDQ
jgi:hypothetical protein